MRLYWAILFIDVVITSAANDSNDQITHILHCPFTGTEEITWLPQCQWSNHEEYIETCL